MKALSAKIKALDYDEEVQVSLVEIELLLIALTPILAEYEKYTSIYYMELLLAQTIMIDTKTTRYELDSDVLIEALRKIEDNLN